MSANGGQLHGGLCHHVGIKQAFTAYNNPKGNADTERFMRTMKEECLWLQEWTGLNHVETEVKQWIDEYNNRYLHLTLGYTPPAQFKQHYYDTLLKLLD